MQLFERVIQVIDTFAGGSQNQLAKRIGIQQTKLNRNLKAEGQEHLWQLLPKVLEQFPQINRYWLYFDEGEMCGQAEKAQSEVEALRQRVKDLEALLAAKEESLTLYREAHTRLHPLKQEGIAGSSGSAARLLHEDKSTPSIRNISD
jgi:hypothetical protein